MNWRDRILNEFATEVSPITWVADPDRLLTELSMQQALEHRGLELVPYGDAITFRFILESKYRPQWEANRSFNLVVVLSGAQAELGNLPYDLVLSSRQITLSLPTLFPKLSYPVIKTLNPAEFDALEAAGANRLTKPLGENATKDFLLEHVFDWGPERVKEPADLLEKLLKRHYQNLTVPSLLDSRLIEQLQKNSQLAQWPLEEILPNRAAFFRFLQDRWLPFVQRQLVQNGISSDLPGFYGIPEPVLLPLDHEPVRVYVDNLFLEGFLQPISLTNLHGKPRTIPDNIWLRAGLRLDPDSDRHERLEKLLQTLRKEIPDAQARYGQWIAFAQNWSELIGLWHRSPHGQRAALALDYKTLQSQVDASFLTWVTEKYKGLYAQFTNKPVMLHHVPQSLSRGAMGNKGAKVALLVLDGLAFDQWLVLRRVLRQQMPHLNIQETGVFAWLPTTTSVSRQALFSGSKPDEFPASIHHTGKEPDQWQKFWVNEGLMPQNVGYLKALGSLESLADAERLLASPKLRAVGLVVNQVDDIMHGMTLGTVGMHNQVKLWAETGFMRDLLTMLFEQGFQVFLTADHGNIEATGIGNPREGAIADKRGERVRVYPNTQLRDQIKAQYPDTIEWPSTGLPHDYKALFAPPRRAFVNTEETIVGHGGISLEELIVPYIQLDLAPA